MRLSLASAEFESGAASSLGVRHFVPSEFVADLGSSDGDHSHRHLFSVLSCSLSRYRLQASFTPVNGTGVVFYVDGGRVRGVLIWGQQALSDPDVVDPTLTGMIERATAIVQNGLREGTVYNYDMNSRHDTLSLLRNLALEVMGEEAIRQMGGRA